MCAKLPKTEQELEAILLTARQEGRKEAFEEVVQLATTSADDYGNATPVADAKAGALHRFAAAIRSLEGK